MKKLTLHSPDITERNIDNLAELFPTVITEGLDENGNPVRTIDFDLLRQELSDRVVEGPQERYHLDWPGKREALFAANAPIAKTLRPVREESVDFDTTRNMFIEGDNLDALKLLQESYLGKVKLIYIDPPYNTGNDFVYEDDFAETSSDYLHRSGQKSESGERLVANTEANGRFHSDWLSMMYPRLKLARNLLTEDGAIFISIDDCEFDNLSKIAAEIFGAPNFIGTMVWAAGRKNDSKFISSSHQFIIAYARNLQVLKDRKVTWKVRKRGLDSIYQEAQRLVADNRGDYSAASKALKKWFTSLPDGDDAKRSQHYSGIDARGVYFPDNISWPGGGGPNYQVLHPKTGKPVKVPSRGWRFQEPVLKEHIANDRVVFGVDENAVPTFKRYLSETEYEAPYSVFYQDGRAATKRLRDLMGAPVFEFPKDELVIESLVEMVTSEDDIVLDFFTGSSTTAHAVMARNAQDGEKRRFIMVQLDEVPDPASEAARAGFATIAELSRERIRRAASKIASTAGLSANGLDLGFRAMKVDTTCWTDVLRRPESIEQSELGFFTESVKPDRRSEDLLFQILLAWGLELALPIERETVGGSEVFSVDDGALVACFDKKIGTALVRELAVRRPLRAVFLDSGFATDADRVNAEQIFVEMSPATDVKAI